MTKWDEIRKQGIKAKEVTLINKSSKAEGAKKQEMTITKIKKIDNKRKDIIWSYSLRN